VVVLGLLEGEAVEVRRYLSRSVTGTWREVHSKRVPAASGSGRPILRAPMRPIRRPPPHLQPGTGGRNPLDAVSKRCMPAPRREAVASSPATEMPLSLPASRELTGFSTAPSPPVGWMAPRSVPDRLHKHSRLPQAILACGDVSLVKLSPHVWHIYVAVLRSPPPAGQTMAS